MPAPAGGASSSSGAVDFREFVQQKAEAVAKTAMLAAADPKHVLHGDVRGVIGSFVDAKPLLTPPTVLKQMVKESEQTTMKPIIERTLKELDESLLACARRGCDQGFVKVNLNTLCKEVGQELEYPGLRIFLPHGTPPPAPL